MRTVPIENLCYPSSESVFSMGSCPSQPIFRLNRVHEPTKLININIDFYIYININCIKILKI